MWLWVLGFLEGVDVVAGLEAAVGEDADTVSEPENNADVDPELDGEGGGKTEDTRPEDANVLVGVEDNADVALPALKIDIETLADNEAEEFVKIVPVELKLEALLAESEDTVDEIELDPVPDVGGTVDSDGVAVDSDGMTTDSDEVTVDSDGVIVDSDGVTGPVEEAEGDVSIDVDRMTPPPVLPTLFELRLNSELVELQLLESNESEDADMTGLRLTLVEDPMLLLDAEALPLVAAPGKEGFGILVEFEDDAESIMSVMEDASVESALDPNVVSTLEADIGSIGVFCTLVEGEDTESILEGAVESTLEAGIGSTDVESNVKSKGEAEVVCDKVIVKTVIRPLLNVSVDRE